MLDGPSQIEPTVLEYQSAGPRRPAARPADYPEGETED
jgi:hypothetical protein